MFSFKKLSFVPALLMLLWACSSSISENPPLETSAATIKSGKEIYTQYCVACHGANGKMGFSGAKDLSKSVLPLKDRILIITYGKGVMNAFKNLLNEQEVEELAIYIESLRIQTEQ